nr:MAG TPA: hypothetical protein [Caudoviricetes sp.]
MFYVSSNWHKHILTTCPTFSSVGNFIYNDKLRLPNNIKVNAP